MGNIVHQDEIVQTQTSPGSGWKRLLEPAHASVTIAISLGIALYSFNEFFLSTALPTTVAEIGGAEFMSWAYSVFLVLSIIGGMVAARIYRSWDARTVLLASAGLFVLGTTVTVLAPDMAWIIAGRAVQGIGLGVVVAVCYILIPELIPRELLPKIFGVEAAVWAFAAFAGPLIAGLVTEHVSWRAAFAINVPMAAVFIVLVMRAMPKRSVGQATTADPVPLLRLGLTATGIVLVLLAGTIGTEWGLPVVLVAGLCLLAAVRIDRRAQLPILPVGAFGIRSALGAGLWVVLLMPFTEAAAAVYLVFGLQELWGFGATFAGAVGALLAVGWSLTAVLVAMVDSRTMRIRLAVGGPVLLAAGMVVTTFGIADHRLEAVMAGHLLMGVGFGINWGPICQLLMEFGSPEDRARTSAMLPTLQAAGFALGAAIFGLVANAAGLSAEIDTQLLRGALVMTFVAACAAGFLALLAGFMMWRYLTLTA